MGTYLDGSGYHGFTEYGGVYATLNAPGASETHAYGINGAGQVVGSYTDATGFHAFVETGGVYTGLNLPMYGAIEEASAFGINDAGQIVGEFTDSSGFHGFIATPTAVVPEPSTLIVSGTILLVGIGLTNRSR